MPLVDREKNGTLTASGSEQAGAVAFYEVNDLKPENVAGSVGRLILGIRLECAQCHDHPFDSWSQDQFWETTAFFTTARLTAPGENRSARELTSIAIPTKAG